MAEPPPPTGTCAEGLFGALDCGSNAGALENQSINALLAAIGGSFASFGLQLLGFMILRLRLSRIYRPRSYLVPEKERVPIPPGGLFGWLVPLFTTSNLAFIQKCGLDAYFFLRYLRMLLKIFFPIALVVLPILLPINSQSSAVKEEQDVKGLGRLAISNVAPKYVEKRLWAHLILAVLVIAWICYVIYRELRGYIRVRQAFLTSPQHRIRASATTVLVTGIPRKWLTLEALNGLYDVFPGDIRNIWINRNFDELADKVSTRESVARSLEAAETNMIKLCRKKHSKAEKQRRKDEGKFRKTRKQRAEDTQNENQEAEELAQGRGTSVGDQHQTPHGMQDVLNDAAKDEKRRSQLEQRRHKKLANPLGMVGDGFGAIGGGFDRIGKGVMNFGRNVVDDMNEEMQETDHKLHRANAGLGFVTDDELYRDSQYLRDGVPPTPPPKSPAPAQAGIQRRDFDGTGDAPRVATVVPSASSDQDRTPTSMMSDRTQVSPAMRTTGPSTDTKPMSTFNVQEPESHQPAPKKWEVWKKKDRSIPLPSPEPHGVEEDEFPLNVQQNRAVNTADLNEKPEQAFSGSKWAPKLMFWKHNGNQAEDAEESYPAAHNSNWDEDQDDEPHWRRYIEPKDRETMRLPVVSRAPSLPLVGEKVDKIYWLRRELARLNLEIEMDQAEVEKFPFMNSAFIQFNHQVAAHMACQSVTHHIPQQMAPRLVEIAPDDVLWDNMSIKWWERYIRTFVVLIVCVGLIIFYAIPVTFTSLLSKVSAIADAFPDTFGWLNDLPTVVKSIIQGLLPAVLLAVILALVPIIFRLLIKQQGVPTGNSKEVGVQKWYFAFLFIQVFLVVTITGGITQLVANVAKNPVTSVVSALAENLPSAANYFFSYLMVQALSISASNLLQVGALAMWFLLGPIVDSTARAKWRRQTTLANVQWGSFFPPFTNFAVIGIIYSVIAPLILVFMLIIFGLFWLVYNYNVLYVYQFRNDTGGLLFPTAVNQLFVGLYVMELCLIGYFFISTDEDGQVVCVPQAVIMVVCFAFTVLFQWLLNSAFSPLFQYLPITLEDEAVIRDEEFARAQASKFTPLHQRQNEEDDGRDIQDILEDKELREAEAEQRAVDAEEQDIAQRRRSHRQSQLPGTSASPKASRSTWHNNGARGTDRWRKTTGQAMKTTGQAMKTLRNAAYEKPTADGNDVDPQTTKKQDIEAQKTVGDVLFSGFADELEDLTPEERDLLVRYAFQHSALRAKRPVVWIPRDKLGVSDDEIKRARKMSTVTVPGGEGEKDRVEKTNIWMSNEGTALDGKGRVVFRRSPPDFSNVDLIAL